MADEALFPVLEADGGALKAGIALCLSGGGYRAMMFHAGCLIRLNETGYLGRLSRVSSVSGGSITAGVLGMNWNALAPQAGAPAPRFNDLVIAPLRRMASTTVDEGAILGGLFLKGSVSDHVAEKYAEVLFGSKTLQDLPDSPRFVLNATNIQSGVLMRMSKPYMRDYRVGQIKNPVLPLARAVGASSAFPPVLSPCEIDVSAYGMQFEPPAGEPLCCAPYTTKLVLSDGGVYDNLGLETAWKSYDTILVSDGGGHFADEPEPHRDWARHAYRVLDLVDSQVRALRSRQLVALYESKARKGCYWGIRQDVASYQTPGSLPCPAAQTSALAATPTRLKAMDDSLQERLMNWGYAICDASLRKYYDPALAAPASFPFPASGL